MAQGQRNDLHYLSIVDFVLKRKSITGRDLHEYIFIKYDIQAQNSRNRLIAKLINKGLLIRLTPAKSPNGVYCGVAYDKRFEYLNF